MKTLFGRTCAAIWGEEFSGVAADTLQVNQRNVQHWAAGTKDVPPGIMGELSIILMQAGFEARHRLEALERAQLEVNEMYAKRTFGDRTGDPTDVVVQFKPKT